MRTSATMLAIEKPDRRLGSRPGRPRSAKRHSAKTLHPAAAMTTRNLRLKPATNVSAAKALTRTTMTAAGHPRWFFMSLTDQVRLKTIAFVRRVADLERRGGIIELVNRVLRPPRASRQRRTHLPTHAGVHVPQATSARAVAVPNLDPYVEAL